MVTKKKKKKEPEDLRNAAAERDRAIAQQQVASLSSEELEKARFAKDDVQRRLARERADVTGFGESFTTTGGQNLGELPTKEAREFRKPEQALGREVAAGIEANLPLLEEGRVLQPEPTLQKFEDVPLTPEGKRKKGLVDLFTGLISPGGVGGVGPVGITPIGGGPVGPSFGPGIDETEANRQVVRQELVVEVEKEWKKTDQQITQAGFPVAGVLGGLALSEVVGEVRSLIGYEKKVQNIDTAIQKIREEAGGANSNVVSGMPAEQAFARMNAQEDRIDQFESLIKADTIGRPSFRTNRKGLQLQETILRARQELFDQRQAITGTVIKGVDPTLEQVGIQLAEKRKRR